MGDLQRRGGHPGDRELPLRLGETLMDVENIEKLMELFGNYGTLRKEDVGHCETRGKIRNDIGGTDRDVAHVRWGSPWRMPTSEEFEELIDDCVWKWVPHGGSSGYRVTSTNGNSIFLPAAGGSNSFFHRTEDPGERGYYWSSTPNNGFSSMYLKFDSEERETTFGDSRNLYSIRPVLEF